MFHTSPSKIIEGSINKFGIAGSCLFFSDEIYSMSSASKYVYQADFNCIDVSDLHDKVIISDIAAYFNVDDDTAESLLDGTQNEWDLDDFETAGEDSWYLQGQRGECAVKMGYDGCEDRDEQGTVYIVPMLSRETELKLLES